MGNTLQEMERLAVEHEGLRAQLAERDAEIAQLKAELAECQVKRDMWEHYYEEEAKGASYMEAEIKMLHAQVAELQAQIAAGETERKELHQLVIELQDKIDFNRTGRIP